jgi:hypothetical protein
MALQPAVEWPVIRDNLEQRMDNASSRQGPEAVRQQISTGVEGELRLSRGEAVWRKWCSEWHATDPHLTALRENQLTRHVVDALWGATAYGVSSRLRRTMMTAARRAIRAHWLTARANEDE